MESESSVILIICPKFSIFSWNSIALRLYSNSRTSDTATVWYYIQFPDKPLVNITKLFSISSVSCSLSYCCHESNFVSEMEIFATVNVELLQNQREPRFPDVGNKCLITMGMTMMLLWLTEEDDQNSFVV